MIPENLPPEKKRGRTHKIWKQCKRFALSLSTVAMFALHAQNLQAQVTVVVPETNEGSAFIGPFGNAARQLQLLIDDSVLTPLAGKNLTSISFRLPASTATAWPAADLIMANFSIYLSQGVEPGDKQLDFAANVVGPQTQVRTGSLEIPAGALTVGSNPNAFSYKILFSTPWTYSGGNLLIEIRHSGTGQSSRSVQAASTSSAGYGTLYSALWQSTGNVTQGNFCNIEITAEGALGTKAVRINHTTLYPNPVKDIISVKSDARLVTYAVYSLTGQRLSGGEVPANGINVSRLSAGTYVLRLRDAHGNEENQTFIKN